jgi:hypothetical protein
MEFFRVGETGARDPRQSDPGSLRPVKPHPPALPARDHGARAGGSKAAASEFTRF